MSDAGLSKDKNLLQSPSLFWDIVLFIHACFIAVLFHQSLIYRKITKAFEEGTGDCRAVLISLGILLVLFAVFYLVVLAKPAWKKAAYLYGEIGGGVGALIFLAISLFSSTSTAVYFVWSAFFIPLLNLDLFFSLWLFVVDHFWRYQAYRGGNLSVRLPAWVKKVLKGEGRSERSGCITLFALGLVLLIVLFIVLGDEFYWRAFAQDQDYWLSDTIFWSLLGEAPIFLFFLAGSYYWGKWRILRPEEKIVALFPSLLLGVLAIGVLAMPVKNSNGEHDARYYSTYSREKWIASGERLRYYMLPDFEKQVNLVGKDYATVIYYLDAPDEKLKTDEGYELDYIVGEEWDGKECYAVSLSQNDIVIECRMAYRD